MRAALALPFVVACASAPRTAAITPPHVAAFDPAGSDPAALAAADAEMAALGGHDHWVALQELAFAASYSAGGQVRAWAHHRWDRWNGRHQLVLDNSVVHDPKMPAWVEVRYALYDDGKLPYARSPGGSLDDSSTAQLVALARQRLDQDGAWLTIVHRLRDPGVHLAIAGTVDDVPGAPQVCKPSCTSIKVTFDPGAGSGAWIVDVNTSSHRPELIEQVTDAGRSAFRIDGWADAGGLEWPARLVNVAQADQVVELSGVIVDRPRDAAYAAPADSGQMQPVAVYNGKAWQNELSRGATPPVLPSGAR
jgi:hypothetical protein